jgi:hypothetical protein
MALLFTTSCKRGPKIIATPDPSTTTNAGTQGQTGIFSDKVSVPTTASFEASSAEIHSVTVLEVLQTERYVYLQVEENGETFWIATGKREVEKGGKYHYKGGLLKTNFESKEYNRTFDKIYLVSNIVAENHSHNHDSSTPQKIETHSVESKPLPRKIDQTGSIKIASITSDPTKYEGKSVQISGECVKINPNIMGRNWIHLKDGSNDDYDFVVTSNIMVPEGHVVTLTGTVALNKDFGAGYRYDIIVENGQLINL